MKGSDGKLDPEQKDCPDCGGYYMGGACPVKNCKVDTTGRFRNEGEHSVKVYDEKGALVEIVPPVKFLRKNPDWATIESRVTPLKGEPGEIIVLDDRTRHVIDSMWLKALGKVPGKTSHETAQSPASIAGLLNEYVEKEIERRSKIDVPTKVPQDR